MNLRILAALAMAAMLSLSASAFAQTVRVVLKGYDPVAYFTDGKATRGEARYSYDFDEQRYYFASAQHRQMFAADPDRYSPQFSGYCTGSMSRGVRNEGHPEAWVVLDGKLYVFGAPDRATAIKTKQAAEADMEAVRVKVAKAAANYTAGNHAPGKQ